MTWNQCFAARAAGVVVCFVVAALASAIAHPDAAIADEVRLLDDNGGSLLARLELLAAAEREIALSYFAIGADRTAMAHIAMLCDAARRGVSVRVLVDAMHNDMTGELIAHLMACGVEVREYHPVNVFRPEWTTRRLHDKLLLVDRRAMITGGRNIEDRYFGLAQTNFRDRDAMIVGSAAIDAAAYFDAVWEMRDASAAAKQRGLAVSWKPPWKSDAASLDQRLAAARDSLWNELAGANRASSPNPAINAGRVRFIHDAAADELSRPGVTAELVSLIANARQSIVVETPYLVLSQRFEQALTAARSRGVRVAILTNSLASTNSILAQAGYEMQRDDMRRMGIELWEFPGPECLHSKAFLFDGQTSVIGSFNLDPRSELRDTQVAVVCDAPPLAAALHQAMARNFAQSRPLNDAGQPARAPWDRRLGCNLSRLLAPLVKDEL